MTAPVKGKHASPEGAVAGRSPAASWNGVAEPPSGLARYYFNLTDGDAVIRDAEGVEVSSIQAAVLSAMTAVEELRAQAPTDSGEWQGWRLEIVDASGRAVQVIPLDMLSVN